MPKKPEFCSFCGSSLEKKFIDDKMRDHCTQCNSVFYENPLPVASTIVVNENREVLLVQRKKDPYMDMWCLPIGFAESDEMVEEAALRELKEEAGIEGTLVQLIDVDTVDNYFYGAMAIVTYEASHKSGEVKAGDDAKDARYFPLDEIPKLAWTSNERALKKYLKIHESLWAFEDLLKEMLPHESSVSHKHKDIMPELLISVIKQKSSIIEKQWLKDIEKTVTGIIIYHDFLTQFHRSVISFLIDSLEKKNASPGDVSREDSPDNKSFAAAVILHRKHLWNEVMDKTLISSPVDALEALELNNRIVSIYDRVLYNLL